MKKSELREIIVEEMEKMDELGVKQSNNSELSRSLLAAISKHSKIEQTDLLKVITNQIAGLLAATDSTGNWNKLSGGLKSLFTKI